MRKLLITLLILLSITTSSLFADMDYLSMGMTGGFSTVKNTPSFGFNASYQYMFSIGKNAYFGLNNHMDFNLQIMDNEINFGTGLFIGPSFGFGLDRKNFLAVSFAPAMYIEAGNTNGSKYDYVGLGLGTDINHTFYFSTYNNFGITFGATGYFMFLNLSNDDSHFTFDGLGYIAFTFRGGDYVGESKEYYNIY